MTKEQLKVQIDTDITNKLISKSISPLNVGGNMKNIIDLIPISDGSETKIVAGDNVTVTGDGTTVTPYVVNSTGGSPQDLQSVLDTGRYAEFDSGNSYINLANGSLNNRANDFFLDNGIDTGSEKKQSFYTQSIGGVELQSTLDYNVADFSVFNGYISFFQANSSGVTNLYFNDALVNTDVLLPAKSIPGDYTINTTPNTIYTVATLPTAVLNDMAIVSDATAPTYLGTLVGGGSVTCPVWYNGTIWVSR